MGQNKTERKAEIGSISSGTMRPADLIPAFYDELMTLAPDDAKALASDANFVRFFECANWDQAAHRYPDDCDYLLESLFDALDALAPDFCYFGAHPGDGADYGFWVSDDAVREAIHDDGILAVDDLADVPDDYVGHVLVTNDHGNESLYRRELDASVPELPEMEIYTEIWSIV